MPKPELHQMRYAGAGLSVHPSIGPKPTKPAPATRTTAPPQPDPMVEQIIASVRAETAERKRREEEYLLNQRRILAQVAQVPLDQIHTLIRD